MKLDISDLLIVLGLAVTAYALYLIGPELLMAFGGLVLVAIGWFWR